MPATAVEDAFMKDLFADLDNTFLEQVLLSSPAKAVSQSAKPTPRPRPPPVQILPAKESILPISRRAEPTPFWFKPISTNVSSTNHSLTQKTSPVHARNSNSSSTSGNVKKRANEIPSSAKTSNSPLMAKKCKKEESSAPPTTRGIIRHTHIVQDGKENSNTISAGTRNCHAQPNLRTEIKEEIVDFDDLLQGVDWGDAADFAAALTQSRVSNPFFL